MYHIKAITPSKQIKTVAMQMYVATGCTSIHWAASMKHAAQRKVGISRTKATVAKQRERVNIVSARANNG